MDTDSEDENEMNNAAPVPTSSEMRNTMKTARGLSATDHVILYHAQVTRTTPELAPPSSNFHTTPTEGRSSSRQIYRASLPYTVDL
ncbi:hypothetical protein TNCV_4599271 [Trichonephila clavipes]|nr:hypothetical protein TNCV_4599271 [Trichonephila clavipes]